jgi:hypothetical protein
VLHYIPWPCRQGLSNWAYICLGLGLYLTSEVVFDVWEVVSTDFGSCTLPNKTCTQDEASKSIVVARKLVSIWLVYLKSCTIFDMQKNKMKLSCHLSCRRMKLYFDKLLVGYISLKVVHCNVQSCPSLQIRCVF